MKSKVIAAFALSAAFATIASAQGGSNQPSHVVNRNATKIMLSTNIAPWSSRRVVSSPCIPKATADFPTCEYLIYAPGGVGIGTTDPQAQLHVNSATGDGIRADGNDIGLYAHNISGTPGRDVYLATSGLAGDFYGDVLMHGNVGIPEGHVGIGTGAPVADLDDLAANQAYVRLQSFNADNGSVLELRNNTSGAQYLGAINFNDSNGNTPGQVGFFANGSMVLRATTVSVSILTITGGSDVAEPFQVTTQDVPKGSVVVIDDQNPGKLKQSDHAYDAHVAGIISGAHGIKPGLSLSEQGFSEGGENVALSGRVYALADASHGAIKPGDLLTTSDTPGHCMKVADHSRAQGAIIGKAMSALTEGRGMVLVLVTLQ